LLNYSACSLSIVIMEILFVDPRCNFRFLFMTKKTGSGNLPTTPLFYINYLLRNIYSHYAGIIITFIYIIARSGAHPKIVTLRRPHCYF
jgi:hypothetical protein